MKKKIAVLTLCAMLFALCASVDAQQPKNVPRIGLLRSGSAASHASSHEAFRQGLRELGYEEAKNILIEYRYAEGKSERWPALANELVRLNVDIIVVGGTGVARATQQATKTIPIVVGTAGDLIRTGLVASLARPGGNITGATELSPEVAGKRLELLKESVPKLSRVAVLWNPKGQGAEQPWQDSQLAARELGLQLHSMEVSSADKYEGAFKEATMSRSTALSVTQHTLASSNQKQIADLAAKNRLPAMYYRGDFVESGGLMSYGADQAEPVRRAASMVDKILKGTKPADIPVEQPTKFEFIINLKAAKQIGLTIPPNVLARADRVIK